MKHSIACLNFKPYGKNTLVGFARICIRELRLIINDLTLDQKGEARRAALPARPQVRDGTVVTDDQVKAQYACTLEFEGREARDAFSAAVWRAVRELAPEMAS